MFKKHKTPNTKTHLSKEKLLSQNNNHTEEFENNLKKNKLRNPDEILKEHRNKNNVKDLLDSKSPKLLAKVDGLVLSYTNPNNPNFNKKVIRNTGIELYEGEVLALIGESGSGKSVISSTLFGLSGDNAIFENGKVIVNNIEVQNFSKRQWEKSKLRGNFVSAVFQNPMTTLNPTIKIGKQIMEGILLNKITRNKKEARSLALYYLEKTRIQNAELVMEMYPHQLSGGMKQRAVIAAIVACQPKVLILDEPTTALDPTVQAEILEIIKEIIKETNMGAIFITHDLGVVASIADRISIMYAGQVVETGSAYEVLFNPQHPYTWGLLLSMPDVNKGEKLQTIEGSVPSNLNEIKGDAFSSRNDYAMGIDFSEEPPMFEVSKTHFAKTWLLDKRAPKYSPPKIILDRWKKFNKSIGDKSTKK